MLKATSGFMVRLRDALGVSILEPFAVTEVPDAAPAVDLGDTLRALRPPPEVAADMQILRRFSVGPSLAFGVLVAAVVPAAADNFLIIVGDDLGVDKIGAYGEGPNPPPTPTIDSLAVEGVLFRNAYAYPNCSPARAAALTGRFGFRTGIGTPGGANLALEEVLLPELVAATHESAALGKWHIGANGDADHPNDSGFDYFAGALANIGDYF